MSEDFKDVIWTDNERTRFILWQAYEGFVEFYNKYMMYSSLSYDDPVSRAGLHRYANYFYEEIRCFVDAGRLPINEVDVIKIQALFRKESFSRSDYAFLRKFFGEFMYVSGIKNIIMRKDQRTNFQKMRSTYGLDNNTIDEGVDDGEI